MYDVKNDSASLVQSGKLNRKSLPNMFSPIIDIYLEMKTSLKSMRINNFPFLGKFYTIVKLFRIKKRSSMKKLKVIETIN